MKITKCRSCGLDVAVVHTRKGTRVVSDVHWDGEYSANTKNGSPVPHNCPSSTRKNKHAKKRF